MRVTSKMMTTNALNNINRNKTNMSTLANQYSTQQKIQRPSEDPVVAVRSLKYRTSISELEQYYKKNVPDAMSWISNTESALTSVNDILTNMNTYFNQGANDTLETTERDALVQTLTEYKDQIFQCLNSDYAGRYLFTGYRTDTPLIFESDLKDTRYSITEPVKGTDLKISSYVVSNLKYNSTDSASDYAANAAKTIKTYSFNLSYNNVDVTGFSYVDSTGTKQVLSVSQDATTASTDVGTISIGNNEVFDLAAYNKANGTDYKAVVIKETGQVITTEDFYNELKGSTNIQVDYDKDSFSAGDVRPEHYFECETNKITKDANGKVTVVPGTTKSYTVPAEQKIQYEVNFSQSITVNTLASESVNFDIINQIDDIISQIKTVQDVENKLSDIEAMLQNGTYPAGNKDAITELKAQVENELALQKSVLQEKFGNGITTTTKTQASVNKAVADLGSRYKRLELTEARLSDQLTSFNEMLTSNDTVDIEDAIVNYTAALTAYNASLNATSKIAQNSLLDFL